MDFELKAESHVAEKHRSQRVVLDDSRTSRADVESRIQMDIYDLCSGPLFSFSKHLPLQVTFLLTMPMSYVQTVL